MSVKLHMKDRLKEILQLPKSERTDSDLTELGDLVGVPPI